ncbi:MAG: hypothetical protein WAW90_03360 [Minisyncoccia bacterium]
MDPELKRALDEIHALTKDNHQILRAIRRDQWIGFFSKIIFWAVMIIIPFYAYQQYLQPIISSISSSGTSASNLLNLPTSTELQKLINSYKAGL